MDVLYLLTTAFLGGLILNFMPCVFPVLSLKILGILNMAGDSRKSAIKYGILYTLGILVMYWILGGVVLLVQHFGGFIGWGFQLQNPIFTGIMAGVMLLISASLFGFFEIGKGIMKLGVIPTLFKSKSLKSFLNGILATLIASPCTGPFLGYAMGMALTLSAPVTFVTFTAIGMGMASPYLIMSAFPNLLSFLPKGGKWLQYVKYAVGAITTITAGWLIYLTVS